MISQHFFLNQRSITIKLKMMLNFSGPDKCRGEETLNKLGKEIDNMEDRDRNNLEAQLATNSFCPNFFKFVVAWQAVR